MKMTGQKCNNKAIKCMCVSNVIGGWGVRESYCARKQLIWAHSTAGSGELDVESKKLNVFFAFVTSNTFYLNVITINLQFKAKKPDRKPDSPLVLKILTKKICKTKRLESSRVYS
jgi:hypothetical protein